MQPCWEQCSELSSCCNACCLLAYLETELKQEMKSCYCFWSGKEKYRLGRESNTVACDVRKTFLTVVQCYLPFTGSLWERKIL